MGLFVIFVIIRESVRKFGYFISLWWMRIDYFLYY